MKCVRDAYGKKGFTLLEIVVSITLLALVITPIMQNFFTALNVNARGRKIMVATDVAQTIMEGFSGKSFEEIIGGMDLLTTGYDFTESESNTALYAFSSINDGFYNAGNGTKLSFVSDIITDVKPDSITFSDAIASSYGLTQTQWKTVSSNAADSFINAYDVPLDKICSSMAATRVRDNIIAYPDQLLAMYADAEPQEDGSYLKSIDKQVYYSYYPDTDPIMAYLVYTRVQKDNYLFDVVCTFVPMAQNLGAVGDRYYTYNVKVSVYDFQAESTTLDDGSTSVSCVERFDDTFVDGLTQDGVSLITFEGSPVATLEGGIVNKNQTR